LSKKKGEELEGGENGKKGNSKKYSGAGVAREKSVRFQAESGISIGKKGKKRKPPQAQTCKYRYASGAREDLLIQADGKPQKRRKGSERLVRTIKGVKHQTLESKRGGGL